MSRKKRLKARYSGTLQLHWTWSVFLALSLLVLDAVLMSQSRKAGMTACVFSLIYFVLIGVFYLYYRPKIMQDLINFATSYGQVQKAILQEFDIPSALLEPDGKILWMNDNMIFMTEKNSHYRKNINTIFPELTRDKLPVGGWEHDTSVDFGEKRFRARIQKINVDGLIEDSTLVDREKQQDENFLYMVYLFDETQLRRYEQENRDQKPVVGLLYIDNYEDVMERTDEVHQSLLSVLVERRVGKYIASVNGLVKKLEKDKYLVMLNRKSLDALEEDRFAILDGVKTINIGNEIDMTVSIGIGLNGKSYIENYDYARSAIEMALGRGGDQAVIKDGDRMTFYGGKTTRNENTTRVKARVKAQALRDLMLAKDAVVTMGHKNPDMDSFGAAVGICRAAMTVGKPAHIVLGEHYENIREWVKKFRESGEYPEDFFITHEQATQMVTNNVALVVVDTNRPSMVEHRDLLNLTKSVVVLDHHRQTQETVENTALSYIEPSSSSACEMVSEILQYIEDTVKLKSLEADSLYGGIIIDTQSFVVQTGVRTFEAAAFLRRAGADITRVRKALRDDMQCYQIKADCVSNAETFMDVYAVSICDAQGLDNPSVIGAQAANELLNITGVKASFVATAAGDKVYISARSIDELNVQIVMERLGGGGHMTVAGAQMEHMTADEALDKVKETLKIMTEEGAI